MPLVCLYVTRSIPYHTSHVLRVHHLWLLAATMAPILLDLWHFGLWLCFSRSLTFMVLDGG
jgi:hypothetical protein